MSDQPESKANHIVVSQENLIKTAKLARLNLDESEISRFQKQIAEACENFEKINEVNVEGGEPLMSPVEDQSSTRPDEVAEDAVTDSVLDQAPELQGRLFRVPPVVS